MKEIKCIGRYASETLDEIPLGYIDKTLPGCGLTSVALENNIDTIVAVPNIVLIDNKVSQYPNSRFSGSVLGVKGNTTPKYIEEYVNNTDIIKIMVTYDSIGKVEHLLDRCKLVIDESQELLKGQKLKSMSKISMLDSDANTELFKVAYKYRDSLSMISATPIPLEYMPKWVSELDQVKLLWGNNIKTTPMLMERPYPIKSLVEEIVMPLAEHNEVYFNNTKITKAVIFINSVSSIKKVLKDSGLDESDDVGVIAGNSLNTSIKLKGVPRIKDYSKLPTFTFITSTGFKGIDLYDKEAISIVVSTINRDFTMIDINVDLLQAVSRIRNSDNNHVGKYLYLYNKKIDDFTRAELIETMERTKESVTDQIISWEANKAVDNKRGFRCDNTFRMYSQYIKEIDSFVINNNLISSDTYFIEQIYSKYKEGFNIAGYLNGVNTNGSVVISKPTYKDVANEFITTGSIDKYKQYKEYVDLVLESYRRFGKVYLEEKYTKKKLGLIGSKDYRYYKDKIKRMFKKGNRYPVKQVKDKLQKLYDRECIDKKANATDLKEIMDIKYIVTNKTRMIEIL
jgi:hypothetical protein